MQKNVQGLNTSTSPVLLETTVPPDFGDLQPREEGQISELRCFQFFSSRLKNISGFELPSVQAARNWCNGFPKTNEVHFHKRMKFPKTNIQLLRYIWKIYISPPRGVPPVASLLDSRLSVDLNVDSPTHPMLETREVFEEEQDESEDQWH